MEWTPRSQRLGKRNYDGPFDGVPPHLVGPLLDWLKGRFMYQGYWQGQLMRPLCIRLHVPIYADTDDGRVFASLSDFAMENVDQFWDVIEGALQVGDYQDAEGLRQLLTLGGSKLTVGPSDKELTEVVGHELEEVVRAATSPTDEAAEELAAAWGHAYGRDPDPSDAWGHAIKAVETVLRVTVEPSNAKATLGSMIAVLSNNRDSWQSVFPGKDDDNDVSNLVATLRLIWPNTDRHGGGGRQPTLAESRAVVSLAATIVQWHREGWVVQKR